MRAKLSRAPSRAHALLLAASLLLAGRCSSRYRFPPALVPAPGTSVTGIASWYGPGYAGKPTASGERFDPEALTAAHERWAFGTRVRVTLLATGKSTVVRINDRFPNASRVIDLSHGAAVAIGLIGPGVAPVRLDVLAP